MELQPCWRESQSPKSLRRVWRQSFQWAIRIHRIINSSDSKNRNFILTSPLPVQHHRVHYIIAFLIPLFIVFLLNRQNLALIVHNIFTFFLTLEYTIKSVGYPPQSFLILIIFEHININIFLNVRTIKRYTQRSVPLLMSSTLFSFSYPYPCLFLSVPCLQFLVYISCVFFTHMNRYLYIFLFPVISCMKNIYLMRIFFKSSIQTNDKNLNQLSIISDYIKECSQLLKLNQTVESIFYFSLSISILVLIMST